MEQLQVELHVEGESYKLTADHLKQSSAAASGTGDPVWATIRERSCAERIFNNQPHNRCGCEQIFFFLLEFWMIADTSVKQKQKTVMDTGCFLLTSWAEHSRTLFKNLLIILISHQMWKNHTVIEKLSKCTCAFMPFCEQLYVGEHDVHKSVWRMRRTISRSNTGPKPIVLAWSSFTLISLYGRILWAFKNKLIKNNFLLPLTAACRQAGCGRSPGAGLAELTRQIRVPVPS